MAFNVNLRPYKTTRKVVPAVPGWDVSAEAERLLMKACEQRDDEWHVVAHMQLGHDCAAVYDAWDKQGGVLHDGAS